MILPFVILRYSFLPGREIKFQSDFLKELKHIKFMVQIIQELFLC